jgi:hypothetical protein
MVAMPRRIGDMQEQSPPPSLLSKNPIAKALIWIIIVTTLLAVFASYGQLAMLLQWVEMKLC